MSYLRNCWELFLKYIDSKKVHIWDLVRLPNIRLVLAYIQRLRTLLNKDSLRLATRYFAIESKTSDQLKQVIAELEETEVKLVLEYKYRKITLLLRYTSLGHLVQVSRRFRKTRKK